jgi:hypothetical protein
MRLLSFRDARGRFWYGRGARFINFSPGPLLILCVLLLGAFGVGAATQISLTTQVQGILPGTNGGTSVSSTATFPTSGTVMTTGTSVSCSQLPALTGNVTTTAGSCTSTVAAVNGTTVPTNSAADQVINTTASATGQWTSLPNTGTGQALGYSTSSHGFSAVTVLTGTLVDAETPSGTCPTTTLTLANTPNPTTSLKLYKNGQREIVGSSADYTLSSATITLNTSCASTDAFIADYRH